MPPLSRWSLLVALVVGACGSDAKTPRAALQVVLDAAAQGDPNGFRAGFPSDEELAELFDCPADVGLAARYDGLSEEFAAWRGARPSIASISEVAKSSVAAGDDVGGCKARRAMTLVRADVKLTESGGDKRYAVRFVDLGERVRVLAF